MICLADLFGGLRIPGGVICVSVTRDHMQNAINELAEVKYFDRLIPLAQR
jgi:hypothetical protein